MPFEVTRARVLSFSSNDQAVIETYASCVFVRFVDSDSGQSAVVQLSADDIRLLVKALEAEADA